MREIQRQGRSEYVVVTEFRKEFNIAQNVKLEYEIVDKGSNGFLSLFGARPTVLKFFLPEKDGGRSSSKSNSRSKSNDRSNDRASGRGRRDESRSKGRDESRGNGKSEPRSGGNGVSNDTSGVGGYIEGILEHMGVEYNDVRVTSGKGETRIQISGVKDRGYLIGREGRLLNALQHLTHRMLLQQKSEHAKVVIDVDNYRNKKSDGIQSRIEKLAAQALETGKSITLDPMPPGDRRVVHQYIEKRKDLKTMTVGNGQHKRVVIVPEGAEAPAEAQSSDANRSRRGRRGGRNRNRKPSPDA